MIRFGLGRRKKTKDVEAMAKLRERLGDRAIVLVGLMGCGKSSIGRRLAARLGLAFVDADDEIEKAANKSISDIFADEGEDFFRERERMVIARLLKNGPQVLATGGGAFLDAKTRENVSTNGISLWLKAELPILMRRVKRRNTRPLLRTGDPEATMRRLINERYPVYESADLTVHSRDVPHEVIIGEILAALKAHA